MLVDVDVMFMFVDVDVMFMFVELCACLLSYVFVDVIVLIDTDLPLRAVGMCYVC